ncbi:hypothetical protein CHUAL_012728 [Chamberlinius hualienensis]
MKYSILVLLIFLYVGCAIADSQYFDYEDNSDDYEEEEEEEEFHNDNEDREVRIRRFLPPLTDFLGVPDTCMYNGKRHNCELSFICWMSGRETVDGCDSLLYRCCVPKRQKSMAINTPTVITPEDEIGDDDDDRQPFAHSTAASTSLASHNIIPSLFNDPKCGIVRGPFLERFGAQRRIIGGDEAGFGHFPWQALIRIGTSRCGGSLVNRFYVVTAGHCVARAKAPQIIVTLGDYELKSEDEPFESESYRVVDVRVHPRFQFTPQADRFDVAVLRLDRPVNYKPHISPICLPRKDESFEGLVGYAAGWGATEPGSKLRPSALQVVDVPIITNGLCEVWHRERGIGVRIFPEMICAGYRGGGKDSCQGDSGGPLMVNRFGVWYLVGLVSAGFSCAQQNQPGIYHRIAFTADCKRFSISSTIFSCKGYSKKTTANSIKNQKTQTDQNGQASSHKSQKKSKTELKLKKIPTDSSEINFASVQNNDSSSINDVDETRYDTINNSGEFDESSGIYDYPKIYNDSQHSENNDAIYEPISPPTGQLTSGHGQFQSNNAPNNIVDDEATRSHDFYNASQVSDKYPHFAVREPLAEMILHDTNPQNIPPTPPSIETLPSAISRQASIASGISEELFSRNSLLIEPTYAKVSKKKKPNVSEIIQIENSKSNDGFLQESSPSQQTVQDQQNNSNIESYNLSIEYDSSTSDDLKSQTWSTLKHTISNRDQLVKFPDRQFDDSGMVWHNGSFSSDHYYDEIRHSYEKVYSHNTDVYHCINEKEYETIPEKPNPH